MDDSITTVTINLTPKAVAAVESALAITPHSQTDIYNRAVQVYAYLEAVWAEGGEVFIRRPGLAMEKLHVW